MNLSLPDLTKLIVQTAQRARLGAVGIVGSRARGEAQPSDDLDLFVAVPLAHAEAFGKSLAGTARCVVHLHEFARVPWFHPYHLCVLWLNCGKLPVCPCPRGATIRQKLGDGGHVFEAFTPVENIPHFAPADRLPPTRSGETSRRIFPSSDVL